MGFRRIKHFDNFVVGKCNEFAHAAAMAVADSLGDEQYNPLYTCTVLRAWKHI